MNKEQELNHADLVKENDLIGYVEEALNEMVTTIDSLSEQNQVILKDENVNEVCSNKEINDKFMRIIDNDDNSSQCSSSSTLTNSSSSSSSSSSTSTSDDEDKSDKVNKKSKVIKLLKNVKKVIQGAELDDDDDDDEENDISKMKNQKYLKTKGEVTIDDLAPIESLHISAESDVKLVKMGRVISIVDEKLVVIQQVKESTDVAATTAAPLDEDSILFDSNRKGLGKIYEIFGPVANPFYSLRFNSQEIKDNGLDLAVGSFIYYAPESNKYTKFIFNVDELRKMKGSDASWNNDNEPPVECLDYSDDEQERMAKKNLKKSKKITKAGSEDGEDDDDDEEVEEGEDNSSVKSSNSNIINKNNKRRFNNKFNNRNQLKKSNTANAGFNNSNAKNEKFQRFPKSNTFQQTPNVSQAAYYQTPFWPSYPTGPMMRSQGHQSQMPMMPYPPPSPHFMPTPPMYQQYYNNFYPNPGQQFFNNNYPPAYPFNQQHQQQPFQFNNFPNQPPLNSNVQQNSNQFEQKAAQTAAPKPASNQGATIAPSTSKSTLVDKRFIKNSNFIKKSF